MHQVAVTGIGMLSCCGEGSASHFSAMHIGQHSPADVARFPPYAILPLPEIDFTASIPRKSDQRQMERWQLMGVHAAGCALEDAGLHVETQRRNLDMHIATNGGGRELDADEAILREVMSVGPELNALMMRKMRPSYFLSQLPNMLAGNIAVVHGVGGASRTFMGEEEAGVSALSSAMRRIVHGQSDATLVGGVQDAECIDRMIGMITGDLLHQGSAHRVADASRSGLVPGSQASFLVLESVAQARARKAPVHAILSSIETSWATSSDERVKESYKDVVAALLPTRGTTQILSGASGMPGPTQAELEALDWLDIPSASLTSTDILGHGMEAHFLSLVTMAVCALRHGNSANIIAAMAGHRTGVAAALLEKAK